METRLRRAVNVTPSDVGWRSLDERIARLIAAPAPTLPRWGPTRRVFLRPLALVAAFVVLTGTVGAAMGLLDRTVKESGDPGLRTAWDRAEVLGIRRTDAGLTITLERAYADLNQVMIGFTVEGLKVASTSSVGERTRVSWVGDLQGPNGWSTAQGSGNWGGGSDGYEPDLAAFIRTWGAPPSVAGTWVLTITSIGYGDGGMSDGACTVGAVEPECVDPRADDMVDGTWRFQFELPKPNGTVAPAVVSDTEGPATVTLTQLRISPTMITGTIALRVAGSTVTEWQWLNGSVRFGGASYGISGAYHVTQNAEDHGPNGDVNEFYTIAGSDESTGTWKIEISDLSYTSDENGPDIRIDGPWKVTVTVP